MVSFFEHQDRARQNTRRLLFLMALGVMGMGFAIYGLLMFLAFLSGRAPAGPGGELPFWRWDWLLVSIGSTALLVFVASSVRMRSLRSGGASIAEMLGGRLVSGNPRDLLEQRLVNVVEEMAIAAGVPVPQVFVLHTEVGINAFAAGFTLDDAAVAVTRGCLEKLTREELQGVIAHELSHVLNGDMRMNIRIMGIVFGIVCIGLLGRFLMRLGTGGRRASRFGRGNPRTVLLALGLGVMLIGLIGEFFGKLIKAAVGRQREFLADASAVQFTRNPTGIAGALKKIGGFTAGASVDTPRADEASHFFFSDIHSRLFGRFSLFASHPPLTERIQRIDPSFKGEFPQVGSGIAQPEEGPVSRLHAGSQESLPGGPTGMVSQVGTSSLEALEESRRLLASLPAPLREASHSPYSACAIVYALLLSLDFPIRAKQLEHVHALSGAGLARETERLEPQVRALQRRSRLPLVELLGPALHELSPEQRKVFVRVVQTLVEADLTLSVFEYVLAETLKERLTDAKPAHLRSRVRYRSLGPLRAELQLVLSLLAHAGHPDGRGVHDAFAQACAKLPALQLVLLPESERLLLALSPALVELAKLTPALAAQVVDACAHAVLANQYVSDNELTLLRAVCGALGSPLPPLPALHQI